MFSWLALRGKCRNCKAPISIQYPLVELLTMLLFVACVWRFGFGWQGFGAILLSCFLLVLAGIDLRTRLLPDQLTLPLLWLGLVASVENLYMGPKAALLGAMAGYLSLWSVYWLFKQLTGKEGMGHGDFKLLAALGAWFGWQALPMIVLLSSLAGAVVGVGLILLRGHDRNVPIPFGPYLALAGWIVLVAGRDLTDAWLRLTLPS